MQLDEKPAGYYGPPSQKTSNNSSQKIASNKSILTSAPILFLAAITSSTILTVSLLLLIQISMKAHWGKLNPEVYTRHYILSHQADFISNKIRSIAPGEDDAQLARAIVSESSKNGLNPIFVAAIMLAESHFRSTARSHKGARGPLQLMPKTAEFIAKKREIPWKGTAALYNIRYNVALGTAYLSYLEDMFSVDQKLILIAYNWGPSMADKVANEEVEVIPSVKQYVSGIQSTFEEWTTEYNETLLQLS